jgi:hypothetical protein
MSKRADGMTMDEAREYCLKLERDRIRSHRKSDQGAFEFAFMSLDAHVEKFDDPTKIAIFSDDGTGAERIFDRCDESERARQIEEALLRLSEDERRFARAVLDGATWREVGISRQLFSYRLSSVIKKLSEKF